MNIYMCCDNWPTCDSKIPDQGSRKANEDRARAAGWHIWRGRTLGGFRQEAILCPRCVGRHRGIERRPQMTGDVPLFGADPGEDPPVGE